VAAGQQIGGNYDPTGNNTQGRVTVRSVATGRSQRISRGPTFKGLELVEVA